MSSRSELRLDWCPYNAAKFAVENWHYSKRMPIGKIVRIGVWENNGFIGAVLFSRGASHQLGQQYGLNQTQCCELTRVALKEHKTQVSRIVAVAVRMLKKHCPRLRLIVSFADPIQGHHGGIYQASNWTYTGKSLDTWEWFHEGRWKHVREVSGGAFGGERKIKNTFLLPRRRAIGKHRYLMPFDDEMRSTVEPMRKPYPKRAGSIDADALADQAGEGGSIPTSALHLDESRRNT
ncbi:hypothetical protein LCGC14_2044850 [marine sediment metagenome]|uniref:Protein Mom n=1 Tax=marine sediment metagenome TaxID=412755 RepID=A0A0F9EQP5_9ZZZZ